MSNPRCPRCVTPIEFDWDYCHTCGLSADEIVAGLAESPGVGPNAAAEWSEPAPPAPMALGEAGAFGSAEDFLDDEDEDDDFLEDDEDDEPLFVADLGEELETEVPPPAPEPSAAVDKGAWARGGEGFGPPGGGAEVPPVPPPARGAPPAPMSPLTAAAAAGAGVAAPFGATPVQAPAPPTPPTDGGDGLGMGRTIGMGLMGDAPAPGPPPVPMLGGPLPKAGVIGGVAMFALLILVFLVFGRGRSDDPSAVQSNAPALGDVTLNRTKSTARPRDIGTTVSTARPAGVEDWVEFTPDDNIFVITMPQPPNDFSAKTLDMPWGPMNVLQFIYADDNRNYVIIVAKEFAGHESEILEAFGPAYAKSFRFGTASNAQKVSHYGDPAINFKMRVNDELHLEGRTIVAGDHAFIVAGGTILQEAVFFDYYRDSFRPSH